VSSEPLFGSRVETTLTTQYTRVSFDHTSKLPIVLAVKILDLLAFVFLQLLCSLTQIKCAKFQMGQVSRLL